MPSGSLTCHEGAYPSAIYIYRAGKYINSINKVECSDGTELPRTYDRYEPTRLDEEPCKVEIKLDKVINYENDQNGAYNVMTYFGDSCMDGANPGGRKKARYECDGRQRFVGIHRVFSGNVNGNTYDTKYLSFFNPVCEDGTYPSAKGGHA